MCHPIRRTLTVRQWWAATAMSVEVVQVMGRVLCASWARTVRCTSATVTTTTAPTGADLGDISSFLHLGARSFQFCTFSSCCHFSSSWPWSCRDQSDYQEFSGSVSGEEEYLPVRRRRRHSSQFGMTRLDPPPHRPNPRAWMDEARNRDGFSGRTGQC